MPSKLTHKRVPRWYLNGKLIEGPFLWGPFDHLEQDGFDWQPRTWLRWIRRVK